MLPNRSTEQDISSVEFFFEMDERGNNGREKGKEG